MNGCDQGPIRVLHVDDDPEMGAVTELHLERESPAISVVSESSPEAALQRLHEERVDCVVSDYNMPEMTGIEFLRAVREDWPDLPFVLFTGRGSEEVASDAISAGVTDYLQKEPGGDQYAVLANRVENAVAKDRAEREVETTTEWYSTVLRHSSDFVIIVDEDGEISYASPAVERVLGYGDDELTGRNAFEFIHPEDTTSATGTLAKISDDPDRVASMEFRAEHADGSWRWLEVRGRDLREETVIDGVLVNVRDITARKEREQELERHRDRVTELAGHVSHDARNQLAAVDARLEMAQDDRDSEHLDAARDVLERTGELIEKTLEFARDGQRMTDPRSIELATAAEECFRAVVQADADLRVADDVTVRADPQLLDSLLENLFLNAVEHGSTSPPSQTQEDSEGRSPSGSRPKAGDAVGASSDEPSVADAPEDAFEHGSEPGADAVTIRVGALEEGDGFYVADDGRGIPAAERERIFDSGYSTGDAGTGLGLAIIDEVARTHGWSVAVTDSEAGGARFEFAGVDDPATAADDRVATT